MRLSGLKFVTDRLCDRQKYYFSQIKTDFLYNRVAQKRKNLVFLRCGVGSVHNQWMTNEQRSWDLLFSHYDKAYVTSEVADISILQTGTKFTSVYKINEEFSDIFSEYDYILLMDDDILPKFHDLDRLFALCEVYKLDCAQASLTSNSYGAWPMLFCKVGNILRYTNFVEIMMPVFSQEAFRQCIGYFKESISGWGLDFLFPYILDYQNNKNIAVIDSISFCHTKAIDINAGSFYRHLQKNGIDPVEELCTILNTYGLVQNIFEIEAIPSS
jgi:hypothetical protein